MTGALILSEHDLRTWRLRHVGGEAPSRSPYGVDALESIGYHLTGVPQSGRAGVRRVREAVEHRSGLTVERPLRAVRQVMRADVVLALLERQGMFPGLLKGLHVPPYSSTPLVIWSCWLADDVQRADRATRASIRRRVIAADLVTHLSRHETETLVDLGIPQERLFPVTYGVAEEFYSPDGRTRDIQVLAVGQDRGRDYGTLIEAVRGTSLTLDIVCRPENLDGFDLPHNVRAHGTVPISRYRELLRRARVVAVPTRELAYPTGSSVALEAASSGCAVAVTATRAMRDYFVDAHTATLVGEGDVQGWRDALLRLDEDAEMRERLAANARKAVVERFNAEYMWTEIAEVLASRGIVPAPPSMH